MDCLINIFLVVCNMSLNATFVILSVLVLRLIIRNLPKCLSYLLWSAVLFRLALPITFTSRISWFRPFDLGTINLNRWVLMLAEQQIHSLTAMKNLVNQTGANLDDTASFLGGSSPISGGIRYMAAIVWTVGLFFMIFISIQASLQIRRKLADATRVQGDIFETDAVADPFVFGVFKPRIILPLGLDSKSASYVLFHERTHIRRLDHITRLIAYLALSVHWFNPFVWLAFALMTDDMEKSCDDLALRKCDRQDKFTYCETLLRFAAKSKNSMAAQLNFGQANVKSRITNILFFKKPILSVMVLSTLFITFVGFSLIADPPMATSATVHEKYKGYEHYFGSTLYSTLSYVTSDNEKETVAPILATAGDVFRHTGSVDMAGQDVSELIRYYASENFLSIAYVNLDLRLVTAKISGKKGFMWVIYTVTRYDDKGLMLNGSFDVLSYWEIKYQEGHWKVTAVIEPP